jgi:hypothetical protein
MRRIRCPFLWELRPTIALRGLTVDARLRLPTKFVGHTAMTASAGNVGLEAAII